MEIHIKKGLDALQTETVLRLLSQTVWACNRKKEAIMESWKHSICYGAYTADGKQIGFARVITDYATQYYICDVVVDADFRHRGVGASLLKAITAEDTYRSLLGMLITEEAEQFYEPFGFRKDPICFMTRKETPVLPLILSMTLPMVLSMLVNSLYNIIDSFFVAQISEEAMTALSLVYPVQNFINAVGIGFGVGINAVIAFYLGAGDNRKADQAATQGLVLAVIHGVVMTVCCITIMPVFLRMFTSSEAVIELGVRYSVVAFAFTLIVTVSMAFEKLFQAVGNMKTTMISLMCGCITNY